MSFGKLIISIFVCQLAGIVGSLFTFSSIDSWYQFIEKPGFTPPDFIFGPVWTLLYLLMGIALYLVWMRGLDKKGVGFAIFIFGIHLVLNALWSIIFFGMQGLGLALVEIFVLWVFILWSMFLFRRISRWAFYLLIPYLLWVSFAMYLNYSIWIIN